MPYSRIYQSVQRDALGVAIAFGVLLLLGALKIAGVM